MKTKNISLILLAALSTATCFSNQITVFFEVYPERIASPIITTAVSNAYGNKQTGSMTMVNDTMPIDQFIRQIQHDIELKVNHPNNMGISINIERAFNFTRTTHLINRPKRLEPDLLTPPPTLQMLGIQNGDTLIFAVI